MAAVVLKTSLACPGREARLVPRTRVRTVSAWGGRRSGGGRRGTGEAGKTSTRRVRGTSMTAVGMPKGYTYRAPFKQPGDSYYQWVDLPNIFYQYRIVWIGQPITDDFANQLIGVMLFLDAKMTKDLNLYINCTGGGDISPTLAVYDTMQSVKSDVGTACYGGAMGAAGFLLAAGTKGKRYMLENGTCMLHAPSGVARGQASDIINETKELIRQKDYMMECLAKKTGNSLHKLKNDLSRDRYFDAEMAKSYGIIDAIIFGKGQKTEQKSNAKESA